MGGCIQFNFRINAVATALCFVLKILSYLICCLRLMPQARFFPTVTKNTVLWNNDYGKFWCVYVNKQWRWCLKGGFYAHCQCHIFLFFDWKWGKVEYVHSKEQVETSWNISGSSSLSRFALLCETNEQWNQKVQQPIKKQTLCLIKNWQITPQGCLLGHRCNASSTATLWKSRSECLHSHLFELDQKMEIAELEADKVADKCGM